MSKKTVKTNAMRHLDTLKIPYIPHELDTKITNGEELAAAYHMNPDQVFKTLVTEANTKECLVFMVPVNRHLSLKKAAKAAGVKSLEMIPQKKLFPLTGYVHGGCSPLGMKKQFRTFIDQSAAELNPIWFSGGKIGVQIEMDPALLKDAASVETADLTE